jgi:hypothetical protein
MFKKQYLIIFLLISNFLFLTYFIFVYEGSGSTNQKVSGINKFKCESYEKIKNGEIEQFRNTPYNFLARYPFFQGCTKRYNRWQNDTKIDENFNYTRSAPTRTKSIRFIRGFIVYFPIDKVSNYIYEFKWLYRSWIEMQKYEPTKWRTDLIVFIDNNQTYFNNTSFFFNKLNCSFSNRRSSKKDPSMCTLIEYKSLFKRDFDALSKSYTEYRRMSRPDLYELILRWIDIFKENNQADLTLFYYFLRDNLKNYEYLDSILMAFDGYDYFKQAGFDFLIRSDMDVFLTPLFANWLPRHCNDFCVGRGGYSSNFSEKRLRRVAKDLNLKYAGIWNLGSTWYSTPHQFRMVSYLTLFGMAYLSSEEFAQPEREGKVGTILWPDWHFGVLLLYGQGLMLSFDCIKRIECG